MEEYNFVTNVLGCYDDEPLLLFYSHIPTVIISLLVGLFIFLKNRKLKSARVLLYITINFAIWSFFDLILWAFINHDSLSVMFFWLVINLVWPLIAILSFVFMYVFINEKNLPIKWKWAIAFFLLPIIVLLPTSYNLSGFDHSLCIATQEPLVYYIYFSDILFSLLALFYAIYKIVQFRKDSIQRNKIIFLTIGVALFLLSFTWANIYASITENYRILQYGMFGMPIFIGVLGYMIVKYHIFNLRVIAAQALVVALIVLIGSLFFVHGSTVTVIVAITFGLSLIFGIALIKSVKREVKQRQELAVANKKLKQLDKAKTEFISITSHQLRTPLTAVKGYISLLLDGTYGKCADGMDEVFNKIETSNNRILTIIEDLLCISRINSGRMLFDFKKSPIDKMVKDIVDTFELKAKDKNLKLGLTLPDKPLPEVHMDEKKINEVISNLVDNAIKYTHEGSVHIFAQQKDDNTIQIRVKDTGMGVKEEDMERLFERFERGKEIAKVQVEGTGLGLYICKKLVDAHRGKIWIESEGEGKGTTFLVELPIEKPKGLEE